MCNRRIRYDPESRGHSATSALGTRTPTEGVDFAKRGKEKCLQFLTKLLHWSPRMQVQRRHQKQFAFEITKEESEMLEAIANAEDRSKAGWVRHAIKQAFAALGEKR